MTAENIKNICAIGTGAMGATTALSFALYGYNVRLYGRSEASIEEGMKNIQKALDVLQARGFIGQADVPAIISFIRPTTKLGEATENADIVIESVAEILETKHGIFAAIDNICPSHTIFATNTSGLSPTRIAEAVRPERRERFVATHFFNPAHLMPLVEVVPSERTTQETMDIACELVRKIGKKAAPMKREIPGYMVNRIQIAALMAAKELVELGYATAEVIDEAFVHSLGLRGSVTGPLESADMGGLHIFHEIEKNVGADLFRPTGNSSSLEQAVILGNLGAKTGQGFYGWPSERLAARTADRHEVLYQNLGQQLTHQFGSPTYPAMIAHPENSADIPAPVQG